MELFITIAGTELNSKRAAKQLHMIADMVKAGVTELDGFSVEYGGSFGMNVDFESDGSHPHADYWDGEHNHIHVDEEGIVISRRGPDKADGSGDLEQLHDKGITVSEWAKAHGGITPFDSTVHDH
jgi:hypothetical protein